jgi:hypothetical protein
MKKYKAKIRVKGQTVTTAFFADSSIHARLIIEYQFGIGCIVSGPTYMTEASEIKPLKPLSPEQSRLASLRSQKDLITKNIQSELARQKAKKVQQQFSKPKS